MIYKIFVFLAGISLCLNAESFAQNPDSVTAKKDTVLKTVKPVLKTEPVVVKDAARLEIEKMPRRAAIRSAIIPGWGQITNHRWWKVPLVYGGFVGIGLVYDFNQTNYKIFLKEAQIRAFNATVPDSLRVSGKPQYAGYSNTGIITIKDGYRRNRDLSILGGLAFYAINIVDAYIDAKFFRFDITDDLTLQVKPTFQKNPAVNALNLPLPGVKFTLSL